MPSGNAPRPGPRRWREPPPARRGARRGRAGRRGRGRAATGAGEVGGGLERVAQMRAQRAVLDEEGHGRVPPPDVCQVRQRAGEVSASTAPRPPRRCGRWRRAGYPCARSRERAGELEVGPRRARRWRASPRRPRGRGPRAAPWRRTACARCRGARHPPPRSRRGEAAEAVERLHAELLADAPFGRGRLQFGRRQRAPPAADLSRHSRASAGSAWIAPTARSPAARAGRWRGEFGPSTSLSAEAPGRDVDGCEPVGHAGIRDLAAADGQQEVGAGRIDQAVLGQRARRDEAGHLAPHHRFGAALLGPPSAGPRSAGRPRRGGPARSGGGGSRRPVPPARRTSECRRRHACRVWSARCRAHASDLASSKNKLVEVAHP